MSFVCNTLQGIPLTWTNSVGRPNSCCWGGGRLGWEEGGRHLSRGHQLPPGWKSFTHCAISCFFTNFSPTLVVVLILPIYESGMWRKVKNIKNHWSWIECCLTWVSYPGGAGDPVWAHPGLQLSRHQGRHLLYLHINSTNYLNKVSSQHLPTYTSRPLSNTIHLHIGSTIRDSWTSPARP